MLKKDKFPRFLPATKSKMRKDLEASEPRLPGLKRIVDFLYILFLLNLLLIMILFQNSIVM